jgi:glycosyltransferase involved in cell wall biosynthesis
MRKTLEESLDADMLIFHPTRHDWIEGKGYADKANDVLLKAFAKLRKHGMKIGMVCCDWGHNVKESKRLISNLSVSNSIIWKKPFGIVSYTRMCKATHIIADQFKIGSFGGIAFKALAAGAPILSYLDERLLLQRYKDVPPVINCKTEDEIAESIAYYYSNRKELEEVGKSGRRWMKIYHNKSDTVNAQLFQFGKYLSNE